jgi:hypothetical protein
VRLRGRMRSESIDRAGISPVPDGTALLTETVRDAGTREDRRR